MIIAYRTKASKRTQYIVFDNSLTYEFDRSIIGHLINTTKYNVLYHIMFKTGKCPRDLIHGYDLKKDGNTDVIEL